MISTLIIKIIIFKILYSIRYISVIFCAVVHTHTRTHTLSHTHTSHGQRKYDSNCLNKISLNFSKKKTYLYGFVRHQSINTRIGFHGGNKVGYYIYKQYILLHIFPFFYFIHILQQVKQELAFTFCTRDWKYPVLMS